MLGGWATDGRAHSPNIVIRALESACNVLRLDRAQPPAGLPTPPGRLQMLLPGWLQVFVKRFVSRCPPFSSPHAPPNNSTTSTEALSKPSTVRCESNADTAVEDPADTTVEEDPAEAPYVQAWSGAS